MVQFKALYHICCCFVRYMWCRGGAALCAPCCVVTLIVFAVVFVSITHRLANEEGLVLYYRLLYVADISATFLDGSFTSTDSSRFSKNESSWRVFDTILKTTDTSIWRCISNSWRVHIGLLGPIPLRSFFSNLFPWFYRSEPLVSHLESLVKTTCAHVLNSCCVGILLSNPDITTLTSSGIIMSASGM